LKLASVCKVALLELPHSAFRQSHESPSRGRFETIIDEDNVERNLRASELNTALSPFTVICGVILAYEKYNSRGLCGKDCGCTSYGCGALITSELAERKEAFDH
jgi:hypothetical protein